MALDQDGTTGGAEADWWRGAVIYQIYPRSFRDQNGDGIGDLRGVIDRMDYIASLHVDAIWLSPFFTSPMKDFGYDVSDYRDVDPMFGTLADFNEMVGAAHDRGIRVLIDLVLSHTSDQHRWFKESRGSRDNQRADWYVWADPRPDGSPPTNWLSIFGGSAWEWDTRRRQYYLHNFLASQPDLNYHNMDVQDAVLDVARFWLDRGVDGFRLDTANMYVHDAELRDNPPVGNKRVNGIPEENPYAMQDPMYNISRPENVAFHERLRAVMDEYGATTSVGEIGAVTDMYGIIADYTAPGRLHMAYSFDFMTPEFSAAHIRRVVERMQERAGGGWPNWAVSNHDVERVASRWNLLEQGGADAAVCVAMIMASLRGSTCLYQGEELGLPEADVPFERLQDPYGIRFWPDYKGRDGCRTPMPWTPDPDAGFSTGEPWLPVAEAHRLRSVATQDADPGSVLSRLRVFYEWRKGRGALRRGSIAFHDTPTALAFTRALGDENTLCVFNPSAEPARFDLAGFDGFAIEAGHGADISGGVLELAPFGAALGPVR